MPGLRMATVPSRKSGRKIAVRSAAKAIGTISREECRRLDDRIAAGTKVAELLAGMAFYAARHAPARIRPDSLGSSPTSSPCRGGTMTRATSHSKPDGGRLVEEPQRRTAARVPGAARGSRVGCRRIGTVPAGLVIGNADLSTVAEAASVTRTFVRMLRERPFTEQLATAARAAARRAGKPATL